MTLVSCKQHPKLFQVLSVPCNYESESLLAYNSLQSIYNAETELVHLAEEKTLHGALSLQADNCDFVIELCTCSVFII